MLTDAWQKSELSGQSGNCLEARLTGDGATVQVRNSRRTHLPATDFTRDEWAAFIGGAKAGQFDLAE